MKVLYFIRIIYPLLFILWLNSNDEIMFSLKNLVITSQSLISHFLENLNATMEERISGTFRSCGWRRGREVSE